jgi:hypothetical protein
MNYIVLLLYLLPFPERVARKSSLKPHSPSRHLSKSKAQSVSKDVPKTGRI